MVNNILVLFLSMNRSMHLTPRDLLCECFSFFCYCLLQDAFKISKGIDGSVLYYHATFYDSGNRCASDTILASSCRYGVCIVSKPYSCYQTPSENMTVSLSATNKLGKGKEISIEIRKFYQRVFKFYTQNCKNAIIAT